MNILFLLRFFPIYGGGETVTICLANAMIQRGHNVGICYLWDTGLSTNMDQIDSKIQLYPIDSVPFDGESERIQSRYNHTIVSSIHEIITANDIHVIINQWIPPRLVFKANKRKAKIIKCRHAAIYINSQKWNLVKNILGRNFNLLLRWYYKNECKYCDKWVLLCRQFEREAKAIFIHNKKYQERITSINNPCRFEIIDKGYLNHKENTIVYVGRLYDAKRVGLLINIWSQCALLINNLFRWTFYIIGDGEDLESLKLYAEKLQLKNIVFTGYKNPRDYYRKAKIFVSASSTEGYPMTIVEAMSYGCVPFIMNTYSSAAEIIEDKKNGFLINNNDVDCFARTLSYMIKEENQLKEFMKRSYESSKSYDINGILMEWEKLFHSMEVHE